MVNNYYLFEKFILSSLIDLGKGEETVTVEKTQVFVLKTVQTNTIPLQVELHQVISCFSKTITLIKSICSRSLLNVVWRLVRLFN